MVPMVVMADGALGHALQIFDVSMVLTLHHNDLINMVKYSVHMVLMVHHDEITYLVSMIQLVDTIYMMFLCADTAVAEALTEANRAAAVASSARVAPERAKAGSRGEAFKPQREGWPCASCEHLNVWWRVQCSLCQGPGPRPAKTKATPNSAMIMMRAKEHYHPDLTKSFEDLGLSVQGGKLFGDPASTKSAVSSALRKTGAADGLIKIVNVLTDPANMVELSTDTFGTYCMQNVVDACGRIRMSTVSSSSTFANFRADNRGLDPAGERSF
eukprot:gene24233-9832_t